MITRSRLAVALGLAVAGVAVVAGCGGGTQSPAIPANPPAANVAPAGGGPVNGAVKQPPNTVQVMVTVRKPARSAPPASSKRTPAYVSSYTASLQITTSPDNATGTGSCSATTCTGSVYAPLDTTSMTVGLLDGSGRVLSTATQAVTIIPGTANTFTFGFNGVAESLLASSPTTSLVIAVPTSFPVDVNALDADGGAIAGPGAVINPSGNTIVSPDGSTQTISLTSSDPSDFTLSALTWNPSTYQLSATATWNGNAPPGGTVTFTPATSVTGGLPFGASPLSLTPVPKAIFVVADPSYSVPLNGGQPEYEVTDGVAASTTATSVEFGLPPGAAPTPNPSSLVKLIVGSNFPPSGDTLSLTSDSCTPGSYVDGGLSGAFPSPAPLPANGYAFSFNAYATSAATCSFTITDSNGPAAITTLGFDNPTIYVQGKARK